MNGYHPPIPTTPRNKSFLEENGELLSADVVFLLSVQADLANKELKFKNLLRKHVLRSPMLNGRVRNYYY